MRAPLEHPPAPLRDPAPDPMQPDRSPVDRLVLLKPYAAAAEAAAGPVTLTQLAGDKPCVLHLFTG